MGWLKEKQGFIESTDTDAVVAYASERFGEFIHDRIKGNIQSEEFEYILTVEETPNGKSIKKKFVYSVK